MSGFPYQPIVMDSVMEPIARGWLEQSNTQDSREAFWQFKRARLLGEAIPADPQMSSRRWSADGTSRRPSAVSSRRPTTASAGRSSRCGMPHPASSRRLPASAAAPPQRAAGRTYPGVVMQSLTIALALCNVDGTLAPLAPYRALVGARRRAGRPVAGSHRLAAARRGRQGRAGAAGRPRRDAPSGDARRLVSRRSGSTSSGELAKFRRDVVDQDDSVLGVRLPGDAGSCATRSSSALEGLTSAVMATRSDDTGV